MSCPRWDPGCVSYGNLRGNETNRAAPTPRREEGEMAAGLTAAHAEKDISRSEPTMNPNRFVHRRNALRKLRALRTLGSSAGDIPIEPFQEPRVAEEGRLDLSGTLEIGERAPGPLVESRLLAGAYLPGSPQILRVFQRQHDYRAAVA